MKLIQKIQSLGLPILALIWVCFFFGTTWLASKQGVKVMPALQLAAIRQFIAAFFYISYFWFKKVPWPKAKQWRTIFILSILNFVLSNGLSTWGVKYISSGLGAVIGAIFPLWIVIISFFNGERLSKLAVVGLLVSFSGVCIVFFDYLTDFIKPDFQLGIFLSVLATITWAIGSMYTKKKAKNFNPYFSIGLQMLISSILLFAYTGATGTSISLFQIPSQAWWSIAYLVVFGSITTFIALIYILQHLPTEVSSIYAYVNPIVAVILGAIIFNEPFTITLLIGVVVVILGIYLINRGIKKGS
ncbi:MULTISPECIES: DMT family transporter [Flavobacterium]|uniref:Drug/metabolite-transporting permease n=2 Tax=Flavobacterium TaxID=237 RepID=A0A2N9PDC6_9FLAO|nr:MULTISPECIES: EamA family transporter [Flavobacterium]QYS87983.1 EamA family transporter [Flavobacterium davisii]RVU90957.1 drug/metabolite-transporting permease [Flavobacterium columnare]SPE78338.1 putative inner membrane transporter YedA [Flavobacterium columnare]